jgi:hypothetical protein
MWRRKMQRRGPPYMEKERKERGDAKVRNGQGISTGAPLSSC